ncbi:MAG: biotin--[acetyl-CoA-carboxylase] ligase [Chlorobi bacterium]|nr:biotin--[acetyl-CoA-carboxylase] ligase [Chlorobiota bacterium]
MPDNFFKILYLDEVGSTNEYAAALLNEQHPPEGTTIVTGNQTSGKGRRQREWHSEPGKNLTFSIILYPGFLEAGKQFYLSVAAALSVVEMLDEIVEGISVKWPNDIYLDNDKVAGILIENILYGNHLGSSILGIGINVNESPMPSGLGAVSLKQATGKTFSTGDLLQRILLKFLANYNRLRQSRFEEMKSVYEARLCFSGRESVFEKEDMIIRARVKGINDFGHIILILPDGSELTGSMDELTWQGFVT